MRAILFGTLLLFALVPPAFSQDSTSPLQTLLSRFNTATVDEKIGVLEESANYPPQEMTPLYEQALRYLIDSPTLLLGRASGDDLALVALSFVLKSKDGKAAELVWRSFELAVNPQVRSAALRTLEVVGGSAPSLAMMLNGWLNGQNVLHRSGSPVAVSVIDDALELIGKIGSPTSFGVLFSTMTAGYGKETEAAALKALDSLGGDPTKPLEEVVASGRWTDRPLALAYAISDKRLAPSEKASIATAALTAALNAPAQDGGSRDIQRKLIADATFDLGDLRWAPSVAIMIQAFDYALSAYDSKDLKAADLVQFIDALGATATHEAAVRLTLYLDLIDSQVQRGQPYDEPVVLSVIDNLGRLGDPVAVGDLLAVGHLGFAQSIKDAAREALSNFGS